MPNTSQWIFIRGLVREAEHWNDFPRLFQRHWPDASIHCLDLPGNGKWFDQPTPLSVQRIVDRLQTDFAAIADPNRPRYILSMSLGSMVSLQWLSQHPGQFAGAVLINTSLRGLSPFYQRLLPRNYGPLLRVLREKDRESREKLILAMTSARQDLHADIARQWASIHQQRPVSRPNAIRQLIAATRFRYRQAPPATPLLVLGGLGDTFVSPACSERLAQFLQVPCYFHPSAGHDLVMDAPEWTLERLREWLSAAEPETGFRKVICL